MMNVAKRFLRLCALHKLNRIKWANDGDRTRDHGVTIHCLYHLTTSAIKIFLSIIANFLFLGKYIVLRQ